MTAEHAQRAELEALAAVQESLDAVLLGVLSAQYISTVTPRLLAELRSRLGGYLIDPVLAGMQYVNPLPGTSMSREIYLFLENTDEDNMRVQTHNGAEWTTLGTETVTNPPPEWRVVHENGKVHVGFVAHDGRVLAYVSGPSGPTRYGSELRAREAVRGLKSLGATP